MIGANFLGREKIDLPCTIEIENTFESLYAHVDLGEGVDIRAGDEVLVHGDPIRVPYGQKVTLKRQATLTRAGRLRGLLTKLASRLDLTELYEVSFSGRKL